MSRLASVFPYQDTLPLAYGTGIQLPANLLANSRYINGEPILDERLLQRWQASSIKDSEAFSTLSATFQRLQHLQEQKANSKPSSDSNEDYLSQADSSTSLFLNALPFRRFWAVLAVVLTEIGKRMLSLPSNTFIFQPDEAGNDAIPHDPARAAVFLQRLLEHLCRFGLAGSATQLAYARACSHLIHLYVKENFVNLTTYAARLQGKDAHSSYSAKHLPLHFERQFYPFLSAFLLFEGSLPAPFQNTVVVPPHALPRNARYWQEQGLRTLGEYRAKQAYHIVTDNDGLAKTLGLLDIRDFCQDVWHRNNITEQLLCQIHENLLQPGTSTTRILDTYMIIINTLCSKLLDGTQIDPSNVLLSHTVSTIREFLKDREDAPKIVISSLLEPQSGEALGEGEEPSSSTETFSGQISLAMSHHNDSGPISRNFEGLDLLDQHWTPTVDSVRSFADIQPQHSALVASQSALRHVTTLAPLSQFVEELEKMLAERLLKSDKLDFNVEMALLKILQTDFGDSQIQACENMLHDMMESSRWNEKVRGVKDAAADHLHEHGFQAKVLSHTSWQTLQLDKGILVSPSMEGLLEIYQEKFAQVQDDRRLDWIKELGRVTVEIDLEDRTIVQEVTPLQAAVIDQFAAPTSTARSEPASLAVEELQTALEADEATIRAALHFWVSKTVLRPSPRHDNTYEVVENLPLGGEEDEAATSQANIAGGLTQPLDTESTAVPTQADLLAQHADMYTAYIVGMLTNMGGMDASRIHSMLTMLVPGGFAFEVEELVELLNDMSTKGQIERAGALWRIVQP